MFLMMLAAAWVRSERTPGRIVCVMLVLLISVVAGGAFGVLR